MRRVLACTLTATLLGTSFLFDVVSLAPPQPEAHPVSPSQEVVPLSAAAASTSASLSSPAPSGAAGPAQETALLTEQVETRDFSVLGVTWDAAAGATEPPAVGVQVRVREADGWTPWTRLELNDAQPHPGTEEARLAAGTASTEPLVTSSADAFQVRVLTEDGVEPAGLEAVVIDPGTSPADGTRSSSAPLSSADAATAPAIVTRAQWGADESLRRCSPSYSSTVVAATVHHTAGSNSYTQAQAAGVVRGIYAYHTRTLGWCDIGYNFLVDKFGTVYEGRHGGITSTVRGAHAGGFNDRTVGVGAMGNYDTTSAPAAMVSAIAHVIGWKLSLFGADVTGTVTLTSAGGSSSRYAAGTKVSLPTVFAHRDVGSTACPGVHLYGKMAGIRTAAAAHASLPTSTPAPTPTPTGTPTTSPSPTPTATPTAAPSPTPTPTPTATPTPTPTPAPVADLRRAVVVPVEVDRTSRSELLAYDGTSTGNRHVLDLTVSGRNRVVDRSRWTLGWSTVVAVEHDGTAGSELLLYNARSGRVVVLDTDTAGRTPMILDRRWAAGWTHVVPVEVDGTTGSEVLLYNRLTGARAVVEIRADATTRVIRSGSWAKGWTALTAVEADRTARSEVSVYNAATGVHAVVDIGNGTTSTTLSSARWAKGLDTVTALESDRTSGSELLAYDRQTGKAVLTDITSSRGATATLRSISWSPGWTSVVALEVDGTAGSELVVHQSTSGALVPLDVSASGAPTRLG